MALIASMNSRHCLADDTVRDLAAEVVTGLKDVLGEYQGEIRIQTADGKVDRLIQDKLHLTLTLNQNELVLSSRSDILGKKCNSKIGSIQELLRFSPKSEQVLRAKFDFDSNHCKTEHPWKSLIVFLIREGDNEIVLETLLSKNSSSISEDGLKPQEVNVHGFFTKLMDRTISPRG